jgi:hypothetical protein
MHSLGSSKETFKWIDERIINYELATSPVEIQSFCARSSTPLFIQAEVITIILIRVEVLTLHPSMKAAIH